MNSKKIFTVTSIALSILTILLFVAITVSYLNPNNYDIKIITYFEKEVYVLCGICYLYIFHNFIQKATSISSKIILSFLCSFSCTVQIFLLNNLWHFIDFNEMFNWEDPASYSVFLVNDLSYWGNGMGFKYPFVFFLMLIACLADSVIIPLVKPRVIRLLLAKNIFKYS